MLIVMGSEARRAISSGRCMPWVPFRDSLDSRAGAWLTARLSAVSATSSKAVGAWRGRLKSDTFLPVICKKDKMWSGNVQ